MGLNDARHFFARSFFSIWFNILNGHISESRPLTPSREVGAVDPHDALVVVDHGHVAPAARAPAHLHDHVLGEALELALLIPEDRVTHSVRN